jgi:hypothetical protein
MTSGESDARSEGRKIELSIEVPGTPEEVWQAIATGPGNLFVVRADGGRRA